MGVRSWRDVDATEAARLVAQGAVHGVDVRTPEEHRDLGHVPGAATLPRDGRPLLVATSFTFDSALVARAADGDDQIVD